jgi:hypothetical protein
MDRDSDFPIDGPPLLDDDSDDMPDPAAEFKRAKYGGVAAVLAGVLGAVVVFLFAPPIPAGEWAPYVRALVSLVAFGVVAGVVWFLTILIIMGRGGR